MTAPRFYCPPPLPIGDSFELPPDAAHHASRVLRLRIQNIVHIFDGLGNEVQGVISEISGKKVVLEKVQRNSSNRESNLHITLAQAMCGSEKMDWVMQKATELGVAEIQPVQTERSVAKLSAERALKRAEHWRKVTIAACEQCGQNRLPHIYSPEEFSTWLAHTRLLPGSKFILLPQGNATLHQQPKPNDKVTLLIGPEGGFSTAEAQLAQDVGFNSIRLGARWLRTETAAMASIAALQTLWGDFNI